MIFGSFQSVWEELESDALPLNQGTPNFSNSVIGKQRLSAVTYKYNFPLKVLTLGLWNGNSNQTPSPSSGYESLTFGGLAIDLGRSTLYTRFAPLRSSRDSQASPLQNSQSTRRYGC